MSARRQLAAGITGVALIGLYSLIMMSTAGAAASWAWILLLAAVVLLALTVRSAASARAGRRDD